MSDRAGRRTPPSAAAFAVGAYLPQVRPHRHGDEVPDGRRRGARRRRFDPPNGAPGDARAALLALPGLRAAEHAARQAVFQSLGAARLASWSARTLRPPPATR